MVLLITGVNIAVIYRYWRKASFIIPSVWKIGFALWTLFLGIALITTLYSPFPGRSLWGQSLLGDGWLYWMLIAAFVLSNALVLSLQPVLMRAQLFGLIIGGAIVAISVFLQVRYIPLSIYSNRGYAAFVLVGVALITGLAWLWRWMQSILAVVLFISMGAALVYTQIRGGILALLVSVVYLLWRFALNKVGKRVMLGCSIGTGGYLLLKASTVMQTLQSWETFSTGRLHLWALAFKGTLKRPLFGWGFDGLGIAFPFIADYTDRDWGYLLTKVAIAKIQSLSDLTFNYLGTDGHVYTGFLISNKAHNIFLDTTVSVGFLGLAIYTFLLGFCLWKTARTPFCGIEAVPVAYLVYTLTWYESAQFSHLAWWSLSIGLSSIHSVKSG